LNKDTYISKETTTRERQSKAGNKENKRAAGQEIGRNTINNDITIKNDSK